MASAAPPRDHVAATASCRRYGAHEHGISPSGISPGALEVYRHLRDAGFEAYLVGGCVRDLLLGHKPKDFDLSTSARPEEVHNLFRRSRIVGRRFQIVHVRSGHEVIEVSTFRGHHSPDFDSETDSAEGTEPDAGASMHTESGMLLRDNVFGTVEEDALRRDFSVNGLYYDPDSGTVLDFSSGVEDLGAGVLRVIGDPVKRYREDPVRMLRAIRFAAKLGFTIEEKAAQGILKCCKLLTHVAAARMFDEVLKLLLSGKGEQCFLMLEHYHLFASLVPDSAAAIAAKPGGRELIVQAMRNSDERIAQGKTVTPAFLFAVLLWPALEKRARQLAEKHQISEYMALHEAAPEILARQMTHITIPRRFSTPMRELWELQQRMIGRRQPRKLATHPRFRAAYDFILLREQAGESLGGAGEWWTRFQAEEGAGITPDAPAPAPARRRRRRGGSRAPQADAPR